MNKVIRTVPDVTIIKLLDKVIQTSNPITFVDYPKISKEAFLDIPVPSVDSSKDLAYKAGTLEGFSTKYLLAAKTLLKASHVRTYRYSYPGSYLDWHTDSDFVGTRIYYTYSKAESIFKYYDNSSVQVDYDAIGEWTCRQFTVKSDDLLWHSVWNSDIRYVFGFSL